MRTAGIDIRVNDEEKALIKRAAAIAGLPVSVWLRAKCRIAAIQELQAVGIDPFTHDTARIKSEETEQKAPPFWADVTK